MIILSKLCSRFFLINKKNNFYFLFGHVRRLQNSLQQVIVIKCWMNLDLVSTFSSFTYKAHSLDSYARSLYIEIAS